MTTSITVRLEDRHIEWLKSRGTSMTEAVRMALDRAIEEESYRRAQEVLRRIPLDSVDDWGDPEDFMLRARPDAR